ncbi:hypothetical protein GGS24DRAFT_482729 [Hypoxylon argillaceum]|nr:hypothetical protein GGS24DRAFT_482729 [Hypoxylon argillaceum]
MEDQANQYRSIRAASQAVAATYHRTRGQYGGNRTCRTAGKASHGASLGTSGCRRRRTQPSHHPPPLGAGKSIWYEAVVGDGGSHSQASQAPLQESASIQEGLLRELFNRFNEHEAATRAHIDSLARSLSERIYTNYMYTERMYTEISHCISEQARQSEALDGRILALHGLEMGVANQLGTLENKVYKALSTLCAGTSVLQGHAHSLRRILDNVVTHQTPYTFPQFRRLPFEVRCMIWDWATPGKILQVRGQALEPVHRSDAPLFQLGGNCSPPATAQVCRESRDIACRDGRLVSLGDFYHCTPDDTTGSSPSAQRRWVWFDSARDSLYIKSVPRRPDVELLNEVRHVTLDQVGYKRCLSRLLDRGLCPRVESIDFICGSVEWPRRTELEFENNIWGKENYFIPIEMIDGSAAEAERLYEYLNKRLGPHPCLRARALLRRLIADALESQGRLQGLQLEAYPKYIVESCLNYGIDKESAEAILKEMVEKSTFRRIWMLSIAVP